MTRLRTLVRTSIVLSCIFLSLLFGCVFLLAVFAPSRTVSSLRIDIPAQGFVSDERFTQERDSQLRKELLHEEPQLQAAQKSRLEYFRVYRRWKSISESNIVDYARDSGALTVADYKTYARLRHRLSPALSAVDSCKRLNVREQYINDALSTDYKLTDEDLKKPPLQYEYWRKYFDEHRRTLQAAVAVLDPPRSEPGHTLAQRVDADPVLRKLKVSAEFDTFPYSMRPTDSAHVREMFLAEASSFSSAHANELSQWWEVQSKYSLDERHVYAARALHIQPGQIPKLDVEVKQSGKQLAPWLFELYRTRFHKPIPSTVTSVWGAMRSTAIDDMTRESTTR